MAGQVRAIKSFSTGRVEVRPGPHIHVHLEDVEFEEQPLSLAAVTMPVHDEPAAWRSPGLFGIGAIVYTGHLPAGWGVGGPVHINREVDRG